MLVYSDLAPALNKWASHYSTNAHDKFELIAVVWLKGTVQNLSNIRFASAKIRYEILSYLREADSLRRGYRCNFISVGSYDTYEDGFALFESVEKREFVTHLLCATDLTLQERFVIEMYFWNGFNLPSLSEKTGHSIEWCHLILMSALEKMRQVVFAESDVCTARSYT